MQNLSHETRCSRHNCSYKIYPLFQKSLLPSDNYKNGRLRHAALVKECGRKCELIDYLPLFFNKITNMYQYVDSRGFSYFTTLYHLSAHGIELVRPIYSAIAKSLKWSYIAYWCFIILSIHAHKNTKFLNYFLMRITFFWEEWRTYKKSEELTKIYKIPQKSFLFNNILEIQKKLQMGHMMFNLE